MVMRDQNVKSRTLIVRVITSVLAVAVLVFVFAGPVGAQDSRIGLKIRTLTAELRKQNNLPEATKGALVTAVIAGGAAEAKLKVVELVRLAGRRAVVATARAV